MVIKWYKSNLNCQPVCGIHYYLKVYKRRIKKGVAETSLITFSHTPPLLSFRRASRNPIQVAHAFVATPAHRVPNKPRVDLEDDGYVSRVAGMYVNISIKLNIIDKKHYICKIYFVL